MDEFEVGFLYRLTTGCNISYILHKLVSSIVLYDYDF